MNKKLSLWIFPLLTLVLGGVIGVIYGSRMAAGAIERQAGNDQAGFSQAAYQVQPDQISNSRRNAITRAISHVSPAVVGINVTEVRTYRDRFADDPLFRWFFGDRTYRREVRSLGSGFLISEDGYIITNDHVAGNASKIVVTLTSGEKYPADLVGTDHVSDLSLLKIDGDGLPYIEFGNSKDVIVGEWAIALGNPFGLFDLSAKPTVTVGVISAVNMNLRQQDGRIYRNMIQTDAAINSGNSGGPLVNSEGRVIGINTVIFTPNQGNIGLGFAIPINRAKEIIELLKSDGAIDREFWTGLRIEGVTEALAQHFKLTRVEGVIVTNVAPNSPAVKAGIKVGDIILEVKGEPILHEDDIVDIVGASRAGEVLPLKILRGGEEITVSLKLEKP